MNLPDDPRGRELQLILERAKYERWLLGETQSLVEREFERVLDTILSSEFRNLTQFQRQRALQLFSELNRQIHSGYSGITQFQTRELTGYATLESEIADAVVRSMIPDTPAAFRIGTGVFLPRHTIQSIAALPIQGLKIGEWFEAQANTMSLETRRIIQNGLIEGKGTAEISRRISADARTQGPILSRRAVNEARAITRTTVTAVQNHAAATGYDNLPEDVSDSYVWNSIRDSRTSPICRALDGKIFKLSDPKRRTPPAHINCRSSISAVILDANGKIIPATKFPGTFKSYDEWLRVQSEAVQNQILGPSRASLWRSGRMTLADAVDGDGRVLNLKQLRAKLGLDEASIAAVAKAPPLPAWQSELQQRAKSHGGAIKIRDGLEARYGSNPEFKAFAKGVRKWQANTDGVNEVRGKIEGVLAGKSKDAEATALLRALNRQPADSPQLFRGIGLAETAESVLSRYPAGKTFDLPMSSFSDKKRIARKFASWGEDDGKPLRVVFSMQNGARAVPVETFSGLWREHEWLSGGRFRVVSSRKAHDHVEVVIEQLGVFDVR